jgi:alkylated DNA nucleotide flippase Atl1
VADGDQYSAEVLSSSDGQIMPTKSWREKLQGYAHLPQVKPMPAALIPRLGQGTIGLPSPLMVMRLMQAVPQGRLVTMAELSDTVGRQLKASCGCTVTTAIFAALASQAAHEAEQAGDKAHTAPYWHVLKIGGELNAKYPGGIEGLSQRLEAEGHQVVQRGKRYFVQDFEQRLFLMHS